jgi:hypothetical protein
LFDTQPIQAPRADTDLASRVAQQQAERQALDTLAQALGRISAGQGAADAIQQGDYSAARNQLANLGEEADQLSDAAKQQLSRSLQQAANASTSTDRQLADRERQAAQALTRSSYADQRQALRNLADQVEKSGARTATADQLARDVGRLQQQTGNQALSPPGGQGQPRARAQTPGQAPGPSPGTAADAGQGATSGGPVGADQAGQAGGPGAGDGSNPDLFGSQPARLDTSGQRVEVPTKLGSGPGVRPPDGTEDQLGTDPFAAGRSASEVVQAQQTGQLTPEQNLVPGEQRSIVRGYFR